MEQVEIWGGIECTVNRVGDQFFDQNAKNGHCSRTSDIQRFAGLGIKKLRYPVLWENHSGNDAQWEITRAGLELVREAGMEPIVTLLHHGSGPIDTHLLDPDFAPGLAAHARKVAERFPWVTYYTPVNEPLTTARFSCLYGHWYPHKQDASCFIRALLNQVSATRAAMAAIREVNPDARLVQTEDLGKSYSTDKMRYQAEFENHRRWLSFDLLCGRVDHHHPMWDYLKFVGMDDSELLPFRDEPCCPDIIGVNYYVTSERFLDHRLELYPERTHGGNGRDSYADICAARVSTHGLAGHYGILREAWERFRCGTALTEVHLGCTREEQIRWFMEAWRAANRLREEGADVRAITAWSLLGAFDWDKLLVCEGSYEPGVFDLRTPGAPRPTALAHCIRSLADSGDYQHPVLQGHGWWRRGVRFLYPPTEPAQQPTSTLECPLVNPRRSKPILICGARGTLGRAFQRICEMRGLAYFAATRETLDITSQEQIRAVLNETTPWAIVNCAGYVRVDEAEQDVETCFLQNAVGPQNLALASSELRIPFLTFSTDLVFDGSVTEPYVESNRINPLNAYGRSKAEGEKSTLAAWKDSLIVRTSAFFGPWDEYNFIVQSLRSLQRGEPVRAASDYYVSPTYVPDLVNACLDLLIDGERGLWHVANQGEICWADLARRSAQAFGLRENLVDPVPLKEMGWTASRPLYSVLGTERAEVLPDLDHALDRLFQELRIHQ